MIFDIKKTNMHSNLTITTASTELYGEEVVAKCGDYEVRAEITNYGEAVLKLEKTGVYTISCADLDDSTLSVPYFGNYAVELINDYAIINVTVGDVALIGATVTATKGSYVVSGVVDGQGECTLKVREIGFYNLVCGEAFGSITVNAFFEVYEIELSNRTYLYNAGDECTDVTNGWSIQYNPSSSFSKYKWISSKDGIAGTKTTTDLKLLGQKSPTPTQPAMLGVGQKINFSGFTKLKVRWKLAVINTTSSEYLGLVITNTTSAVGDPNSRLKSITTSTVTADYVTAELDISDVNTSAYLCACVAQSSTNASVEGYINQIWLE